MMSPAPFRAPRRPNALRAVPRRRLIIGALLLALSALTLFMPLRIALGWLGLEASGLRAQAAAGTIWSGRLGDVSMGPLALGTLDVGLRALPLLAGRGEVDFSGASAAGPISGTVLTGASGRGVRGLSGAMPAGAALGGLPVQSIRFADLGFRFDGQGRCLSAGGRMTVNVGTRLGGLNLTQGLSGDARCDAGALLLPLTSQSGLERLTVRVTGDRRYTARLSVMANSDPLLSGALQAIGFRPIAGGFAQQVDGRF